MEWYDIEVDGEHTVKLADLPYVPSLSPTQVRPSNGDEEYGNNNHKLGAIIRQGEWAWSARGSILQIVSLRNGQTISSYEFCDSNGYDNCGIKCVEELCPNNPYVMLLAVVLERFHGAGGGGSFVIVYSVELSCILSSIELGLHATCARFMNEDTCRRSLLQNFDGCLAVGSEEGVVILLDLNIRKISGLDHEILPDVTQIPCHIVDFSLPLTEIHRNFRQCQQDEIHFGLQMEVIESPCSIQCILPIDLITGLAIGLEDGRMALYDLAELQIFFVALPKREIAMSALVKMDYLEPPDDPRPCLYIWALHENGDNLYAVMHNLMYEKRLIDAHEEEDNRNHKYYFELFVSCSMRLQLPLEATQSVTLSCQAISTLSSHGEDDSNCLCAISWFSVLEEKNKLIIFDLNQWYKEEMPFALQYDRMPSYLAGYILNGQSSGLHVYVNPETIAHFNSMQRYEEHFYPNSLSFNCALLHQDGCRCYNWEGAQNRVINLLKVSSAAIFLEPNNCFHEIMRARLMPQFTELNINSTFSRNAKYEIILSTALEHNCISLLRDCAVSWIDGSFMGDFAVSTGLSLSTLTDWIWQRATFIKSRCNKLCKGLFEFGGYPLDHRELKELGFITRQLKLLLELLGEILQRSKKQIPANVYSSLENNHNSLRMASNYQDILLWLLNIGLLPEASPYNAKVNASHDLVPYPYQELKDMYKKKRLYFANISDCFISKKSGSCRLLFIDAFIEHACKGNDLHEFWLENDGDGLYPPNSIEAMLRVMLVPELDYEDKYAILLYFFLDLNMAIDEEAYKGVVANFIKFPSVFKLSAPLIKTVQSFWNLDHGEFLAAVDEFISPFNKNQSYPQWMVELLIESLLTQNSSNLALRILESQPSLISPVLKLKALLANKLIAEAFHFVRSKYDDSLLEIFFNICLRDGQFGVIRDLALTEREGRILQSILKGSKAPGAESLHFVYLLQKSKYIEAVSYMDELSSKSKSLRSSLQHQHSLRMDTPNMVLSAFNTTMTPVTQGLTDVYFRIKNKIKRKEVDNKSPVPLSCQLIKQNANNLLGGIYHSSALSAHFATYYWGELEDQRMNDEKHLLNSNNAPFLRKPQIDAGLMDFSTKNNISYPQVFKVSEKRSLVESEIFENADEQAERQRLDNIQNPKKRRKLIGQDIVENLSHFMKMNKQKSNTLKSSDFEFNKEPEQPKEADEQSVQTMEMLTRPLTSLQRKKGNQDLLQISRPELQSILKTNTPDSQGHLQEEEKYLRFRLPSIDLNNSDRSKQGSEEEPAECEVEEQMDIMEYENLENTDLCETIDNSNRIKEIARAVSEESARSEASSRNSSEDNFYSPLSSQNNSKLDCSNVSRCSFLSGPKARKPLPRLSAEKEIEPFENPSVEKNQTFSESLVENNPSSRSVSRDKIDVFKRYSKDREIPVAMEIKKIGESMREEHITSIKVSSEESDSKPYLIKDKNNSESKTNDESYSLKYHSEEIQSDIESVSKQPSSGPAIDSTGNANVTSSECYTTAMGSTVLNISSRKPLLSVMDDEMDTSEQQTSTSESNYITCVTQPFKLETKIDISETSSGFGSISKRSTLMNSKITEFLPKVSSSKVGSTPFKAEKHIEQPQPPSPAKLSECTTVVGSFDYTSSGSKNVFAMPSVPVEKSKIEELPKHTEEEKRQMMETTLSMSTYDISILDSTSLHSGKSSLMTSNNDKEKRMQEETSENVVETAIVSEKEEIKQTNEEEVHMEIAEERVKLKLDGDALEVEHEKPPAWGDLMNSSDDDCIVLSSSSSYIDDNDYGRPFDFRSSDESDDEIDRYVKDVESEKSFDTGEYDDYTQDVAESDNDVSEADADDRDGSNDVVELIEDTSLEACSDSNFTDQSGNVDKTCTSSSDGIKSTVTTTTDKEGDRIEPTMETSSVQVTSASEIITSTINLENSIKDEIQNIEVKACNATDTNTLLAKEDSTNVGKSSGVQLEDKTVKETFTSFAVTDPEEQFTLKIEEGDSVDSADLREDLNKDVQRNNNVEYNSKCLKDTEDMPQSKINDLVQSSSLKTVAETSTLTSRKETTDSSLPPLKQDLNTKTIATPRRSTRGASIPPSGLEAGKTSEGVFNKTVSSPIVRSLRGTSVPPTDLKTEVSSPHRNTRGISVPPQIMEAELKNSVSSPRRITRGISNPPHIMEADLQNAVSSPRRKSRGISVPPQIMETDLQTAVSSPRRNTRGISVPPQIMEADLQTTVSSSRKNSRGISVPPQIMEADLKNEVSSPRRITRGISVPPQIMEGDLKTAVPTPRRKSRGISVPPQIMEADDVPTTPTRSRRSIRASSLQPKYKMDDNNEAEVEGTPRKRERNEYDSEVTARSTRGSSVPADSVAGKVSTRRRSIMVIPIGENSPAAHTRLRSRLNSMESDIDQSPTEAKRTRRASFSNTSAAAFPVSPKRDRRYSISTQTEGGKLMLPRAPSALSAEDDENAVIPPSPKPGRATRTVKRSHDEPSKEKPIEKQENDEENAVENKISVPKEDAPLYSTTSRRLTRNQLAIIEKSAAIQKNLVSDTMPKDLSVSPTDTSKRTSKARSTRSVHHDSDDTDSTTSKLSTTSSAAPSSKRRVTRKSLKDKEEDDAVSIASSVGSERHPMSRRSKDKSSPVSTLSVIPEDAPVESKKRGRKSVKH